MHHGRKHNKTGFDTKEHSLISHHGILSKSGDHLKEKKRKLEQRFELSMATPAPLSNFRSPRSTAADAGGKSPFRSGFPSSSAFSYADW
jgi:hypothetical protein